MTRNIDIKSEEQVGRINRLACEAPYEVWISTDTVMGWRGGSFFILQSRSPPPGRPRHTARFRNPAGSRGKAPCLTGKNLVHPPSSGSECRFLVFS